MTDNNQKLATRLREALAKSGLKKTQIAEICGVTPQAVTGWLRDGKISRLHLSNFARATAADLTWILCGIQSHTVPDRENQTIIFWDSPDDLPEKQYVFVPRVFASLSAGHGEIVFSEETGPPLAFTTAWIKSQGLYKDHLILVNARGDSMEPTINDGDILLVNTNIMDHVKDGKIYAIRFHDELRVKRLYRRYDGGLIIRSDNKMKYPDESVPSDAVEHIAILGRVIWAAGSL